MTRSELTRHRWLITILTGTGVVVGVAVAVFTADVIIGVVAGGASSRWRTRWSGCGPVTPVHPSPIAEIRHAGTGFQAVRLATMGPYQDFLCRRAQDSRPAAAVTDKDGPAGDHNSQPLDPKAQDADDNGVQCTPR